MTDYIERWYNGGEILARRTELASDSPAQDLIAEIKEMSKGLKKPAVSFEYEPPEYGGFSTITMEVSGKPKRRKT